MSLVVQSDSGEGDPAQSRTEWVIARGDHIVRGLVLLEHQPHRPHVVARKSPVALGVEIAHRQLRRQPERDPGGAVGHLARDEFQASPRRLVVEQDAGDRIHPVALAVVDGQEVAIDLGHAVWASRVERVVSVWGTSRTLPNISLDEAW